MRFMLTKTTSCYI